MNEFEKELRSLINRHSIENASNTPDYILADFIAHCLIAFNRATHERDRWYGKTKEALPTTETRDRGMG